MGMGSKKEWLRGGSWKRWRVAVCNLVMLLDEIDKMGFDLRGNPASALLEGYGCPGLCITGSATTIAEVARVDASCSTFFLVHSSLSMLTVGFFFVTLDEWSSDEIDAMVEVGGNSSANSI
ncbi:hypothetical protein VNO80_22882 [Phaseolus coccineus]|uniref:Uncharacterized protein n=1 Tax=Phaseolus coccineus TaxID=3886 RepID=A0AAN9M5Y8_PHACN